MNTTGTHRTAARRGRRWAVQGLALGAVALGVAACGGGQGGVRPVANAGTQPQGGHSAAAPAAKIESVTVIGKVDADSGAPGTFTSKEDWPAMAPSEIHVTSGATVTLTIKEYDDAATALPDGSPYNQVMGGTETVDGKAVTTVSNTDIAHTITIPALGINIPLPKAPEGGVTTVTFTFKAPASGTYQWRCMTPCGSGANGMGGAMQTDEWMRGHLVVA